MRESLNSFTYNKVQLYLILSLKTIHKLQNATQLTWSHNDSDCMVMELYTWYTQSVLITI